MYKLSDVLLVVLSGKEQNHCKINILRHQHQYPTNRKEGFFSIQILCKTFQPWPGELCAKVAISERVPLFILLLSCPIDKIDMSD